MAESSEASPTQAADTQAAAPETASPSPAVDFDTSSPFSEHVLARRPDLAAKYGPKKQDAAPADEAAAEGAADKGDGGSTPDKAEDKVDDKTEADATGTRVERALTELREMLRESPEAIQFLEKLAKQKNLAGPFIELKRRTIAQKKHGRALDAREYNVSQREARQTQREEEFETDPKAFSEKHRKWSFRNWLNSQVEEESLSPERKELRALKAAAEEDRRELAELREAQARREREMADRTGSDRLRGYIASEQADYPYLFALHDLDQVTSSVWDHIKQHYIKTGAELDWRAIVRQEDQRLRQNHERLARVNRPAETTQVVSSERANGSQKANPAGKKEPSSLSNADASERVSEAKPKNRQDYLRSVLQRHGIS